jgi:hypothetical protein
MKKIIVETRVLSMETLRCLCIRQKWFTRGTIEDYNELLTFVDDLENINTETLQTIAEIILRNSDIEKECRVYGISKHEYLLEIMLGLNDASTTYFS